MTDQGEVDPRDPQPGDWIQIWAQVVDRPVHPEDYVVELFSHSEQYAGHVRRDHAEFKGETPPFAQRCRALYAMGDETYRRCVKTEQHSRKHRDKEGRTWSHLGVAGFVEDR